MVQFTRSSTTTILKHGRQQQLGCVSSFLLLFVFLLVAASISSFGGVTTVSAYPDGAGSCSPGASLGGPHLSGTVTTGSIGDYKLQLKYEYGEVGNSSAGVTQFADSGDTLTVILGKETTYTVQEEGNGLSASSIPLKGFLIKLTGTSPSGDVIDTTDFASVPADLLNTGEASIAAQCTLIGVGGVTHTSKDEKFSGSAIFNVMEPGEYLLSVTVVVASDDPSIYYYSEYPFSISDDSSIPTITDDSATATDNDGAAATDNDGAAAATDAPASAPMSSSALEKTNVFIQLLWGCTVIAFFALVVA